MTGFRGGFGGSDPTHDDGTVMNGAPGLLLGMKRFCGGFGGSEPTHDGETVMNGAPGLLLRMRGFCGGFGGRDPTHDDGTVMNGAPSVAEVAGRASAGGDEELGALEVDVIAGQAVGDVAVGFLNGRVGVEILDEEHVVLD